MFKRKLPNFGLIFIDACLIVVSILLAYYMRFDGSIPRNYMEEFRQYLPLQIICYLIGCTAAHSYSKLWLYADPTDRVMHIGGCFLGFCLTLACLYLLQLPVRSHTIYILAFCFIAGTTSMARFLWRFLNLTGLRKKQRSKRRKHGGERKRLLIYGAGIAGAALIDSIRLAPDQNDHIVGLIDDDRTKVGKSVRGIQVLGTGESLNEIVKARSIDAIIIAIPTATGAQMREILTKCKATGCEMRRLLSTEETVDCTVENVRPINVEDLLGRDPVKLDNSSVSAILRDKVVMVTGGGGSIGSELCRQIMTYRPRKLIIFDIYENNAYTSEQELLAIPENRGIVHVYIGSVRDRKRLTEVFALERPQVIFHAAAHKHVPLMEHSPCEAIKNNVLGTRNVVEVADEMGAERFVMISTDKAVNPTNVMGATKRIGEMLIQSIQQKSSTHFSAVRFGNVLGSNGSVIPLFQQQIARGGPVCVVHKDITRFFMTISEAVSLILQSAAKSEGGEIFILDMGQPVRIDDLARDMIRLSGHEPDVDIKIVYTGLRPGEKLYEEVLMHEEGLRDSGIKGVKIGKPMALSYEDISARVDMLDRCVQNDPHHIRNALMRAVPTYRPQNLPDEYLDTKEELAAEAAKMDAAKEAESASA